MNEPTFPALLGRERWLLWGLLGSLLFSVYLMFPVAGGAHPLPFAAGLAPVKMVRDALVGLGIAVLVVLAWRRAGQAGDPSVRGRLTTLVAQIGRTALPFLVTFGLLALIQLAVAAVRGDSPQLVAVAMGLRNIVLFGGVAVAVALSVRPVAVGTFLRVLTVAFTVVAAVGLLETRWDLIHHPIWDTTVGADTTRRISSLLPDHIRCGIVCALGVTLWSVRLLAVDRRRPLLLAGAGFVVCAAALAATGARAPAAAALAGVLVVIVRCRRWRWLAVLPVLLVAILASAPGLRERVAATVNSWSDWGRPALEADLGELREDLEPDHSPAWEPDIAEDRTVSSTRRRLSTVKLALLELREGGRWVVGMGLGTSSLALKYAFGARVMPLESAVFNILYEAGLVGLACTVLLVVGRPRRHEALDTGSARDAWGPALLGMLVVLGLMSVTYETTAGFPVNLLFGAVIGLRRRLGAAASDTS